MNLLPLTIAWAVLGLVVLVLAGVRKYYSGEEDDVVHLSGAADVAVTHQVEITKKLDKIDKWGKLLTVILAATGLILLVLYGIQVWQNSSKTSFS